MSSLIPVEDYLNRAERDYVLEGKTQFEFPVRARSTEPDYYVRLDQELQTQKHFKVLAYRSVKEGFVKTPRPSIIGFDIDFLFRQRPYVNLLRSHLHQLAQSFSFFSVLDFARSNYVDCSQNPEGLSAAFEVFQYLLHHKDDIIGFMPRQIPHGQSTKLIGREPLLLRIFNFWFKQNGLTWFDFYRYFQILDKPAEFRFFAPHCLCQNSPMIGFHGLMAIEWHRQFLFPQLDGTLIIENLEAFYRLTPEVKNTLLIWGGGWKAALLKQLLPHMPTPIFYWGDIDKEGYEIYAFMKKSYPPLKPLLMSRETLITNKSLVQKKDVFQGPFRIVPDLQNEYEDVCLKGWQIEQEQLPNKWPFTPDLS